MKKRLVNGRTRKKGYDVVGEKIRERKLINGAEISLACERWLAAKEGVSVQELRDRAIRRMKERR